MGEILNIRLKEWMRLDYYDPEPLLVKLREFALSDALLNQPYKVGALRTQELKPYLERRQCAIFAYLMSQVVSSRVDVAYREAGDYDSVMRYRYQDEIRFVPVQMKELVPEFLNPQQSLQDLVDALRSRYPDSSDLTVAVHVNRDTTIRCDELNVEGLQLRGLWLFGGHSEDQSEWRVAGNLLDPAWSTRVVRYPGC